jgi:hypothetical protein
MHNAQMLKQTFTLSLKEHAHTRSRTDDDVDMYLASKDEAELKNVLWSEMNKCVMIMMFVL